LTDFIRLDEFGGSSGLLFLPDVAHRGNIKEKIFRIFLTRLPIWHTIFF